MIMSVFRNVPRCCLMALCFVQAASAFNLAFNNVGRTTTTRTFRLQQQQQQRRRTSFGDVVAVPSPHVIDSSNMPYSSSTSIPSTAVPSSTSTSTSDNTRNNLLEPEDAWIANLDYSGFAKEVSVLGKELRSNTGNDDVDHLYKLVQWRNIAAFVGLSTIWMNPNPITIIALSTWTYSSWSMIAHHTCHGGYNRVDAGRYKSRGFALGLTNRIVDWLDWMQPEAWNVEHNRLHHYSLNEGKDPDLVQRNLEDLREANIPVALKHMKVFFLSTVWKWFYYAPNTYKELRINEILKGQEGNNNGNNNKQQIEKLPENFDREQAATIVALLDPSNKDLRKVVKPHKFFLEVLGPMFIARYVAIPSLLYLIPGGFGGPTIATHALLNLLAAELLTNVHAFVTIVTNHGKKRKRKRLRRI
jgi:hypothetical protein